MARSEDRHVGVRARRADSTRVTTGNDFFGNRSGTPSCSDAPNRGSISAWLSKGLLDLDPPDSDMPRETADLRPLPSSSGILRPSRSSCDWIPSWWLCDEIYHSTLNPVF